jgi:hypothetical protein
MDASGPAATKPPESLAVPTRSAFPANFDITRHVPNRRKRAARRGRSQSNPTIPSRRALRMPAPTIPADASRCWQQHGVQPGLGLGPAYNPGRHLTVLATGPRRRRTSTTPTPTIPADTSRCWQPVRLQSRRVLRRVPTIPADTARCWQPRHRPPRRRALRRSTIPADTVRCWQHHPVVARAPRVRGLQSRPTPRGVGNTRYSPSGSVAGAGHGTYNPGRHREVLATNDGGPSTTVTCAYNPGRHREVLATGSRPCARRSSGNPTGG